MATNSTFATTLTVSKLNISFIDVESGLQSYNKKMPEELKCILTDHPSTILCYPTKTTMMN